MRNLIRKARYAEVVKKSKKQFENVFQDENCVSKDVELATAALLEGYEIAVGFCNREQLQRVSDFLMGVIYIAKNSKNADELVARMIRYGTFCKLTQPPQPPRRQNLKGMGG